MSARIIFYLKSYHHSAYRILHTTEIPRFVSPTEIASDSGKSAEEGSHFSRGLFLFLLLRWICNVQFYKYDTTRVHETASRVVLVCPYEFIDSEGWDFRFFSYKDKILLVVGTGKRSTFILPTSPSP